MKLSAYIEANGLTPTSFAKKVGVPASTIFRILNGDRKCGLSVAEKISEATNGMVTLADLRPEYFPHKSNGDAA